MDTQPVGYKVKAFGARKLAFLFLVVVLLLPASTRQPQPARVEEITFQSGPFKVVGDLRLPSRKRPFPGGALRAWFRPGRPHWQHGIPADHGAHVAGRLCHLCLGQARHGGVAPKLNEGDPNPAIPNMTP